MKVDVAYSHTNVKLIGISGGISYGALGMTHHSAQDIAALASIPGMRVYLPSDRFLTQALMEVLVEDQEPAYIRVGRNAVEDVYPGVPENFQMDKALTVREGSDVTLIACGEMVRPALDAAALLAEKGISARVLDMYCVKPLDREAVKRAARETKAIVTVEEHSIFGGMGSMVSQVAGESHSLPVKNLALPDEPAIAGKSAEVFAHYGLDAQGIARAAEECIAYQIADVLELMGQEAGVAIQELRVDGGPTKDKFLMQFQSDILNLPVAAPEREELSGMGAAFCAGIAAGVYSKEIFQAVRRSRFLPGMEAALRRKKREGWKQAVETLLTRPGTK